MIPRIDLGELARRENEQTEWKENVADVDDVVATLTAFANDPPPRFCVGSRVDHGDLTGTV